MKKNKNLFLERGTLKKKRKFSFFLFSDAQKEKTIKKGYAVHTRFFIPKCWMRL